MSATLRPKAMQLLGVRPDEYWFREWPRVFPAVNSPVYWVPTGRMGRKAGEEGLAASVARIDEIIAEWGHLKGIVHTPSYKLAEYYQAHSRYGRAMILNEGGGREKANDAAGKYRQCTTRPCVLVSPSFSTGWDFPADAEGAWQVIPKLPFADMTDPVVKARMADDPEWYTYECMQQLVQACGRQTRSETDKAVTFITDDLVKSFRFYGRSFAPKWWSVRDSKGVPGAPR
jgi:Rad3-related DNA helicase